MHLQSVVAAAVLAVVATASSAPRPNILLIIWDDAGIGDVTPYPNEMSKPRLLTKAVQKLRDQGMLFTSAYTGAPVCAPSRAALNSGRHCGHIANTAFDSNTTTMADVLTRAGYEVAITGKWGLSDDNPKPKHYHGNYTPPHSPGDPLLQGFGVVESAVYNQWTCHDYYNYFVWDGAKLRTVPQNANASQASCGTDHEDCYWAGDMFADAAEAYLQRKGEAKREAEARGEAAQPWLLYLSFTSPHAGDIGSVEEVDVPAPRASKWPYQQRGRNEQWPQVEIDFATAISETDNRTGSVLAELERQGLEQDTLVILLSDNGAHNEGGHKYTFFNSSSYLNGFKRSIHDGGIRSQGIVRWPGHVSPGSVSDQQFAFYDLFPTLAELAGVDSSALPSDLDGQSFAAVLADGAPPKQPPFLYHEFPNPQDPVCSDDRSRFPHGCEFGQAVHIGNMSAVCLYPRSGSSAQATPPCDTPMVYNLTADPGQRVDIADEQPAFVARAKALFVSQHDPRPW